MSEPLKSVDCGELGALSRVCSAVRLAFSLTGEQSGRSFKIRQASRLQTKVPNKVVSISHHAPSAFRLGNTRQRARECEQTSGRLASSSHSLSPLIQAKQQRSQEIGQIGPTYYLIEWPEEANKVVVGQTKSSVSVMQTSQHKSKRKLSHRLGWHKLLLTIAFLVVLTSSRHLTVKDQRIFSFQMLPFLANVQCAISSSKTSTTQTPSELVHKSLQQPFVKVAKSSVGNTEQFIVAAKKPAKVIGSAKSIASINSSGSREPTTSFIRKAHSDELSDLLATSGLQISITPRVSLIRLPVESNAILKCLISSQVNKFNKKFDIHWSRYMYDENIYEQIESLTAGETPTEESSGTVEASSSASKKDEQQANEQNVANSSDGFETISERQPDRQQQLRDLLTRSRQEINPISELLIEATLSISAVKASDNASYFCTATDGLSDQKAQIDLVALSRPIVRLERVHPARDSRSALIHWLVISDGNTPIKKTILMVRNDTKAISVRPQQQSAFDQKAVQHPEDAQFSTVVTDSDNNQWQRIDIPDEGEPTHSGQSENANENEHGNESARRAQQGVHLSPSPYDPSIARDSVVRADVDITSSDAIVGSIDPAEQHFYSSRSRWRQNKLNRRQRSFNLSSLLPGVTYNFRLAAVNDMGQSGWTYLSATMPNEIPAQISEVFLLSQSNDSLAVGWRRPTYDGAKTVRYEMQLFDLNRTLTLDANTNTSSSAPRTNFMYIFVNLNPGTDYHFHVRACSRAGCSAFSSPKLLATTLDGEADEPTEVELFCQLDSGKMTVSWMPPVEERGQLLNYSVVIDSYTKYRNQSGQWTVDQWRSTMETADNETLKLETDSILAPNTNYTARVCAHNRSKHCGRLSSLSKYTQCSTPADLPSEFPPGIKLTTKSLDQTLGQLAETHTNQLAVGEEIGRKSAETLVLELPFISQRNGTIDCIQVVLIRLPNSFNDSASFPLTQFLPSEPRDIKLSQFVEIQTTDNSDAGARDNIQQTIDKQTSEKAVAYLAEELDQFSIWSEEKMLTGQTQEVVLGDGSRRSCKPLADSTDSTYGPKSQAFDGMLKAQTYYTAFIKLIVLRQPPSGLTKNASDQRQSSQGRQIEVLTKYSQYLSPVKTGDSVIQIATPRLDSASINPFGDLNSNSKLNFQEIAARLGSSLKIGVLRAYNSTSMFVSENVKLDAIGNFIAHSSPSMQLLEIGAIAFILSLLLLFLIYIMSLPASMRRRRKRNMKKRLQKHQETDVGSATNEQQPANYTGHTVNGLAKQMVRMQDDHGQMSILQQQQQQQQQQQNLQVLLSGVNQQPQQQQQAPELVNDVQQTLQVNANTLSRAQECPIHSSPASRGQPMDLVGQVAGHVCKASELDKQYLHNAHAVHPTYHQHNNVSQRQINYSNQEQYERNCKTMRRVNPDNATRENDFDSAAGHFTLSHHNSVLALARKINKSIPLRMFGSVFECRLRNGWLRDEYEQLPRQQFPVDIVQIGNTNEKEKEKEKELSKVLKLRPQLVVSRSESVSALISGNDQFDASMISLVDGMSSKKKSIICARSPLDADSVWDFWRLIYEQEVSTMVMLTQNEDPNTGEVRCAQYWPTCDNEETTILSPCNEFVQRSNILPAKFKIRQETLEEESRADNFRVRRLTLMVMATRPGENEQAGTDEQTACQEELNEEDDEALLIAERNILHFQFYYWNTSTLSNQMRLIKFIEMVNERHARQQSIGSGSGTPMLVHCFNGIGRTGIFAAMSSVIEQLAIKLNLEQRQQTQQEQQPQKINLFNLVSQLRCQRDMLLSPYRFYELLYQLTANCIPIQDRQVR